jgi:signal transduction histidine kinase
MVPRPGEDSLVAPSTAPHPARASLFRALADAVPEPIAFFTPDQALLAMNPAFGRIADDLFGAPMAERSRVADLPQPDLEARLRTFWTSVLARSLEGSPLTADLLVEGREGPRRYAVSLVPVREGASVLAVAVGARPVEPPREGAHRAEMELTLARLFSEETPIETSLRAVLEFLCQTDGWDLGIAWIARAGGLEAEAVWHDGRKGSGEFENAVRAIRFERGQGFPGRVFDEQRVRWVPDLLDETGGLRWPFALPLGFRGVVAVPLRSTQGAIGVLELFTRAVRPVNETIAGFLEDTGVAIGRLVERGRADDERRRLQEELALRGSEWAQTFDAIELPIFITTADGAIIRSNRGARELAGNIPLERRAVGRIEKTELWRTLGDMVRAVVETRSACTAQSVDRDGARYWDLTANLFSPADGSDECVILILRDVTTTVTLQDSVRRGEQLAAMGELVAGVAHEVRNPLFGMSTTLDAYEGAVGTTPDGAEMIRALRTWIGRMNVLMEDLLEYGKTWKVDLAPGELDDALTHAVAACGPLAEAARVTIEADIADRHLSMLMDHGRLVRALQNVVMNAIQHTPSGGRVSVTASRLDGEARGTIRLAVHDAGPGFSPADLPKIFQPFFTRRRGGTGLGLPIVLRITDEHGGTVRAMNGDAGGGVVQLEFPEFPSPDLQRQP